MLIIDWFVDDKLALSKKLLGSDRSKKVSFQVPVVAGVR